MNIHNQVSSGFCCALNKVDKITHSPLFRFQNNLYASKTLQDHAKQLVQNISFVQTYCVQMIANVLKAVREI